MASSLKNFAKVYAELAKQRTSLPALPEPFTKVDMVKMGLDEVLVRNCDPTNFENNETFGSLFSLLSDPDEWETAGTIWLYLHQLTFFTIRSGTRAALFLRYAEMRHQRLFSGNGGGLSALANTFSNNLPSNFDASTLGDFAKNFGGGEFVDGLKNIFSDADALDENSLRAKIHEVFVLMKGNPMMAMLPITEESLFNTFIKMMPAETDEAMDVD